MISTQITCDSFVIQLRILNACKCKVIDMNRTLWILTHTDLVRSIWLLFDGKYIYVIKRLFQTHVHRSLTARIRNKCYFFFKLISMIKWKVKVSFVRSIWLLLQYYFGENIYKLICSSLFNFIDLYPNPSRWWFVFVTIFSLSLFNHHRSKNRASNELVFDSAAFISINSSSSIHPSIPYHTRA